MTHINMPPVTTEPKVTQSTTQQRVIVTDTLSPNPFSASSSSFRSKSFRPVSPNCAEPHLLFRRVFASSRRVHNPRSRQPVPCSSPMTASGQPAAAVLDRLRASPGRGRGPSHPRTQKGVHRAVRAVASLKLLLLLCAWRPIVYGLCDFGRNFSFCYKRQEEEMSSPQVYSGASLGIRLFIVLLVLISMILIMTAPGVCFWRTINGQQTSQEICPPSNSLFPMNIDRWNSAIHFQMRGQNVWGQLAVIIISIIFAIPSVIFSCLQFANGNSMAVPQMLISGVCVIVFLVLGAVETWYATGFDHMQAFIRNIGGGTFSGCAGFPGCETGFVVKGWAAAAAFLFLSAILFCIDVVLVFLRKDK
ncbi:hypothetical protein L596_028844 [Steinernema carpocapsae]|uniref:MARVEL domain-containing protein n=1 Tax=Steinernema carpocapsae TaxID=34508 RepID=A0A4U5LZK4_STECR|nr:hypothetical protein L596_028844 [Steinernema carpocapsae]